MPLRQMCMNKAAKRSRSSSSADRVERRRGNYDDDDPARCGSGSHLGVMSLKAELFEECKRERDGGVEHLKNIGIVWKKLRSNYKENT
ncbi:uncharacterized [Tachysurus ichikawai]